MYSPTAFVQTDLHRIHALMRDYPLATLISPGPQADHIPLLFETPCAMPDETSMSHAACSNAGRHERSDGTHGRLLGHIARANPLWRNTPQDTEVLCIFHGGQGYVSPSWYPSKQTHGKAVPTWNYSVVHARGRIHFIEDGEWLWRLTSKLSDIYEERVGSDWKTTEAPACFIEQMLGQVVGVEIRIDALEGKAKLSQNRSAQDRQGVIEGLQRQAAMENLVGDMLGG